MASQTSTEPAIDLSQSPIVQIGVVVADAVRTAGNYARLFGLGPWVFDDTTGDRTILHGRKVEGPNGYVRGTVANFANVQLELIEPLFGPSSHIDHLRDHGEGVQHLSFGILDRYDDALAAWQQRGIGLELQGVVGGCIAVSYADTIKELGAHLELIRPLKPDDQPVLGQWGMTAPPSEFIAAMAGRAIRQVGIVVRDVEETVRHYEDLLGVGPWTISGTGLGGGADAAKAAAPQLVTWKGKEGDQDSSLIEPTSWTLHGVPMLHSEMHLKTALCDWNGFQIKLIQPLAKPGVYWEFLNRRGPGVHHLGFGHVDDYDALLDQFAASGIAAEMTGTVGATGRFAHLATAKDLGVTFQIAHMPDGGDVSV